MSTPPFTPYLLGVALLLLTFSACKEELVDPQPIEELTEEPAAEEKLPDVSGTYIGTAEITEEIYRDGVLVFDTAMTSEDRLEISQSADNEGQYNIRVITPFRPQNGAETPYISSQGQHYIHEPYYFTDKYIVSVGYERDIGYTYDEKKHWVFDPAADTVFFRLQRAPSYTTQLSETDSAGNPIEELHNWDYVFRGER